MTGFKKVLLNSGYLLGFRLISRLLSVIFLVYAASRLGPEAFGVLSITLVTVELMITVGDLGVTRYSARELVRSWNDRQVLSGKILSLQVVTSLVMSGVAFLIVIAINLPQEKFQLVMLGLASFFFYSFINTSESVFTAGQKFFFSAFFTFIGRVIYLALGFIALEKSDSIILVMWGFLASVIIEALLRTAFVRARITGFSFRFPWRELRTMLRTSVPFAVTGIATVVAIRANIYVLALFQGDASVGVFNAAFTLFTPFVWLAIILNVTLFPGLTADFARDPDAARTNSWRWYRLTALAGIPMAMMVTLVAGPVTGFFPEGFAEIKPILIILMWSLPPALMNTVDIVVLQVIDRESVAAKGLVIGAVGSILFSFALIPLLGGMGAAVALLLAAIVRLVYIHNQAQKAFVGERVLYLFIRPAIAGGIMGLAGFFALRVNPWFASGLGLLVYAVTLIAIGGVHSSELKALRFKPAESVNRSGGTQ